MTFNPTLTKSKVISNIEIEKDYFITWFSSKEITSKIKPGQFLMVETDQYLSRPFSVYEVNKDEIGIMYKKVGKGTEFLSGLENGSEVLIHGPLGKTFLFPEDKNKLILIVAGGIGIATFPFLARTAKENKYKVKTLYGARSKTDLVLREELLEYGELLTITDDGSSGRKGFVTELLIEEINKNNNLEILVCGPTPMLNSVIKICNEKNLIAQVSFEEHMACGYGVCMSCVVMSGGKYIRTCVEGPVMKSDKVLIG